MNSHQAVKRSSPETLQVLLIAGKAAHTALDGAAQVRRQVEGWLVRALLVLLHNLPRQSRFGSLGAFGLFLQPAEQPFGDFHPQRFHVRTVTPVCENSDTNCGGLPQQSF